MLNILFFFFVMIGQRRRPRGTLNICSVIWWRCCSLLGITTSSSSVNYVLMYYTEFWTPVIAASSNKTYTKKKEGKGGKDPRRRWAICTSRQTHRQAKRYYCSYWKERISGMFLIKTNIIWCTDISRNLITDWSWMWYFQNDSYFGSSPSRSRPGYGFEEEQEPVDPGDVGDDQMGLYSGGEDYMSD